MIREKLSVQNAEPETGQKVPSKYRTEITAFLFLFPSLIGFAAFFIIPAVRGLYLSLTDWDLFGKATFIGLENYKNLMTDESSGMPCS